jgi:hypothetical protein
MDTAMKTGKITRADITAASAVTGTARIITARATE